MIPVLPLKYMLQRSENQVTGFQQPAGVIWDMDGVLVDTGEWHYQSWVQALAPLSIPYSRDQFRDTFGMNNRATLTHVMGRAPSDAELETVSERKETLFRAGIAGQAVLLPGVLTLLQGLQAAGFRQAIASSAPPENIDTLVDSLHIRPYFAAIIPGSDLPAKPDPAIFLKAAQAVGLPPGCCVVVEDSIAGVGGAKRAGMGCIAVTNTNPAPRLVGADLIVSSLEQVDVPAFLALLAELRQG
jgi:HAD superfamily hydrolase (TIGR01509 family)